MLCVCQRLLANWSICCAAQRHMGSLPVNRGFATHVGYLEAAEHYYHGLAEGCDIPQYADLPTGEQHSAANPGPRHGQWPPPGSGGPRAWQCHFDMWHNRTTASSAELAALTYDTNTYAQHAVSRIEEARPSDKMFIHLMWHAVHAPYTPALLAETINPADPSGYYANYCPPPGTP